MPGWWNRAGIFLAGPNRPRKREGDFLKYFPILGIIIFDYLPPTRSFIAIPQIVLVIYQKNVNRAEILVDSDNAAIARSVPRIARAGNLELRFADLYAVTIGDRFRDALLEKDIKSPKLLLERLFRRVPRRFIFLAK